MAVLFFLSFFHRHLSIDLKIDTSTKSVKKLAYCEEENAPKLNENTILSLKFLVLKLMGTIRHLFNLNKF